MTPTERTALAAFTAHAAAFPPTPIDDGTGAWWNPLDVYPARDTRDAATRRTLRRLADRGLLEKHPHFDAYRPRAH